MERRAMIVGGGISQGEGPVRGEFGDPPLCPPEISAETLNCWSI
jgi:hypothetical protein